MPGQNLTKFDFGLVFSGFESAHIHDIHSEISLLTLHDWDENACFGWALNFRVRMLLNGAVTPHDWDERLEKVEMYLNELCGFSLLDSRTQLDSFPIVKSSFFTLLAANSICSLALCFKSVLNPNPFFLSFFFSCHWWILLLLVQLKVG